MLPSYNVFVEVTDYDSRDNYQYLYTASSSTIKTYLTSSWTPTLPAKRLIVSYSDIAASNKRNPSPYYKIENRPTNTSVDNSKKYKIEKILEKLNIIMERFDGSYTYYGAKSASD